MYSFYYLYSSFTAFFTLKDSSNKKYCRWDELRFFMNQHEHFSSFWIKRSVCVCSCFQLFSASRDISNLFISMGLTFLKHIGRGAGEQNSEIFTETLYWLSALQRRGHSLSACNIPRWNLKSNVENQGWYTKNKDWYTRDQEWCTHYQIWFNLLSEIVYLGSWMVYIGIRNGTGCPKGTLPKRHDHHT